MEHNNKTGLLEMYQDGPIERIVEALGLDDGMVKKAYAFRRKAIG